MIDPKLQCNDFFTENPSLPSFASILDHAPSCILVCKDSREIIYMNKAMRCFYHNLAESCQLPFVTKVIRVIEQHACSSNQGDGTHPTIRMQKDEDTYIHAEIYTNLIRHNDSHYHIVALFDQSVSVEREFELRRLAQTDSLTGAYNRFAMSQKLENTLGHFQRSGMLSCLLYLDIDHFKLVNDTYGHSAGDEVLKQFSDFVKNRLRKQDDFGRIGGEEFCIILMNTTLENSVKVAEKILEHIRANAIETIINGKKNHIHFTCSIGIAELSKEIQNIDDWLGCADSALYQAKRNGRDNVCVWEPSFLTKDNEKQNSKSVTTYAKPRLVRKKTR